MNMRTIDINIYVLDYNFNPIDEISGRVISASSTVDASSDIRRTISLSIEVKEALKDYWQAGNPYWWNKFIRIEVNTKDESDYVDNEYISKTYNQGYYLIDSPSIDYEATSSTLSFSASDMMCKLTGDRNGYLEGISYQINSGSNINKVVRNTLKEQGFNKTITEKQSGSEIETTPNDINIDLGGTAYDILTNINDINPNWEMFFDVNGVFRYQPIPSGNNESVVMTEDEWQDKCISYSMNTNFNDVKNYIEIVGKQVETDEVASSVSVSGTSVNLTLAKTKSQYLVASTGYSSYSSTQQYSKNSCVTYVVGGVTKYYKYINVVASSGHLPTDTNYWEEFEPSLIYYIGFVLGNASLTPTLFSSSLTTINVVDSAGTNVTTITIPNDEEAKIHYNNETYYIRLRFGTSDIIEAGFMGYIQPRAIAFENNVESPFYVGDVKDYVCSLGTSVDFVNSNYTASNGSVPSTITGNKVNINLVNKISHTDFENANVGHIWEYNVPISLSGDINVTQAKIKLGGYGVEALYDSNNEQLLTNSNQPLMAQTQQPSIDLDNLTLYNQSNSNAISLDISTDYIIAIEKLSASSIKVYAKYYPIRANNWESPTTKIYNVPRFDKMVRMVYSGDEYDNIYSNTLAKQRAKYNLYLYCRLHDEITITTVPIYDFDVNKLFEFKLEQGNEVVKWISKNISTDFSVSGTQTITATRYYPLYN